MIRKLTAVCLAISVAFSGLMVDGMAATKKKPRGPSLPLIRDAEIEGLLRLYSKPIFKAAGLNPSAVRVYIINNDKINAFVAGGQRLFIHTGLLTRTKTPNEIIGVLAHETGHIAGGHLARMGIELDRASVQINYRHLDWRCSRRRRCRLGAERCGAGRTGNHDRIPRHGAAEFALLPARHGSIRRPGCPQIPQGNRAIAKRHADAVPVACQ